MIKEVKIFNLRLKIILGVIELELVTGFDSIYIILMNFIISAQRNIISVTIEI